METWDFAGPIRQKDIMRNQKDTSREKIPKELAVLNEFAAACLDTAQKELGDTGTVKGAVNFAYGLKDRTPAPVISQYVLTRQGTDGEEREIEEVTNYAKTSCAEAVSVVIDLAGDSDVLALFSGSDGLLLVAAASSAGSVTIMRPYKKSTGRLVFADPTVTDRLPVPIFEGLFASFK